MARAILVFTAVDTSGNVLNGATCTIYEPGSGTPIAQTLYAAATGGTTVANPITADANGGFTVFVDSPQTCDVQVVKGGFATRTIANLPFIGDPTLTNQAILTTTGDLPYASGARTPARLPIGTTGQVLGISGGVPAWTSALNPSKVRKTADYVIQDNDGYTWILANGSVNITLPAAANNASRKAIAISHVQSGGGLLSIVRAGGDLVAGQTKQTMNYLDTITVDTDGSNFFIV